MNRTKNILVWSIPILVIAFLALISCGQAQKDTKPKEATPAMQQSQTESDKVEPETSEVQQPIEESGQVVLNPPHGQPGHRCEIPVGSPLNASPTAEQPTSTNNAPSATEGTNNYGSMASTVENARRLNASQGSRTAAPATGEKPEVNPPHGQPWHRCDIAVGSPLP